MNFQQLEYCLAVKQFQHFGKAAESCNITQATLSGMIKKLEQEVGFLIFDRSQHPIVQTEKGENLVNISEKILHLKSQISEINSEMNSSINGVLKIGVIPTVANSLLPLILETILLNNPELELNIYEITTEEILQQLKTDQIDFGILSTPLPKIEYQLIEEKLYHEPLLVYGITDEQKKSITKKDIQQKQIWLLEEGHCFRSQTMSVCDLKDSPNQKSKLNFKGNSFETLINLCDQFGGYTLIPKLFYQNLSKGRKKRCRSFDGPIPVREISLVSSRPFAKRAAMKILGALIREKVDKTLPNSLKPEEVTRLIEM